MGPKRVLFSLAVPPLPQPFCVYIRPAPQIKKLARKKQVIVFLDEADRIRDIEVFYHLIMSGAGIVLAFTRPHALFRLPSRLKSSLPLTEVEFPRYSSDELNSILKDRVEY